jgi:hypothetical protein
MRTKLIVQYSLEDILIIHYSLQKKKRCYFNHGHKNLKQEWYKLKILEKRLKIENLLENTLSQNDRFPVLSPVFPNLFSMEEPLK